MNRSILKAAALVAATCAIAALGCSSDTVTGTTTSTPPSDSGSATSSTGLTITVDSGVSGQTVPVRTPITVTVHVKQNGVGVTGQTVTWGVASGGGTLSSTTTTTDTTGLAVVTWTLGDSATTNSMTATISGAAVTVYATTTAGPVSTLLKASPDSQIVAAGGTVALTAVAVDRFANPDSGVVVTWSATGGTLSAAATTTGASGDATTNFTVGPTPGTYAVTAAVANRASVTFIIVSQ